MPTPVGDDEVDSRHDAYMGVLIAHARRTSRAMTSAAQALARARRAPAGPDLELALAAMQSAGAQATSFREELAACGCPTYLRGADGAMQEGLQSARRRRATQCRSGDRGK